MNQQWDSLIGYPIDEATNALREEAVPFIVKYTTPPFKAPSEEEAYVIAVRSGEVVVLICARSDWTVK